jgi:hypothetical protein
LPQETGVSVAATGTVRDSLHMIDVVFRRDGGGRPEVLVTDTCSYSDVVFGLVHLLGMQYRPALADIPDQKGWRAQDVGYGALSRPPSTAPPGPWPARPMLDGQGAAALPYTWA